jgi:hypothetical protein
LQPLFFSSIAGLGMSFLVVPGGARLCTIAKTGI